MIDKIRVKSFKVESFGAVDGPGIRLVIFTQGCPMRCLYCHNPESWSITNDEAFDISIKEILDLYKKNEPYYKKGGITISGGEPTLHLDFLIALARETKKRNIHLTIDTACYFWDKVDQHKIMDLVKHVDLWLVDIKWMDKEKCKYLTGVENLNAQGFIKLLEQNKKHYWVRYVLVPDLNNDNDSIEQLALFIKDLKYMDKFEFLPYHEMAKAKYENLKIKYRLQNTRPATGEDVKAAMDIMKKHIKC